MFQDYKVAYLRKHVKIQKTEPFSFLRTSVAYILSQSSKKVPQASMVTEFDVTPLVEYARDTSEALKSGEQLDPKALFRRAIRKNFSAFFLKAVAHCLHRVPIANGFLDYAPFMRGGTYYQAEDINLAFTVGTKYGVIATIVRNPHLKTLEAVAEEMRTLARKARKTDPEELYRKCANAYVSTAIRQLDFRALPALWIWILTTLFPRTKHQPMFPDVPEEEKLQVEDVLGATASLANIGMMLPGVQTHTIVVPPEVMFFGIGDLHLAPRVVDGKIVPRYVISVCATMDHRPFDAGAAFPLHEHMRSYVANPQLIYEWKTGDDI
jgi:pyruvate/2-oxoglutarate dehydrogenase complex dihydrolipoamide acyltransferase (E2) component